MQRQIILTPLHDRVGWMATVPSLPGCVTEGDTKEEAIAHAEEAMTLYVETLEAKGWDIPPEDEGGIIENPNNGATTHRRKAAGMYQNTGTRQVRSRAAAGKPRHAGKR